jgi:cytochrome c553
MTRDRRLALALALLIAPVFAPEALAAEPAQFIPSQRDYLLGCAGCHGADGSSNAQRVPTLKGLVGYYLNLPEGRAYLPRLPNVAFSTLSDGELAALLNYMVFEIGAGSAPAGTKPYGAAEVGKFRKQPLTEVTLSEYRRQMVETLITDYHAPAALRVYGQDLYGGGG